MQADATPVSRPVDPGLSSEFHRWPLPGYLWPALEKHSQSIFCTEPHLRIHGTLTSDIEAWVMRRDGRITGLWLFRRQGRKARVLNEVMAVSVDEMDQFADALFARYSELDMIELHALHLVDQQDASPALRRRREPHLRRMPLPSSAMDDSAALAMDEGYGGKPPSRRPWQRACVSEDFVLELPASVDDWYASLSARTREKLRQCLRRAQRGEPTLSFRVFNDVDISERQVLAVLKMSRARMRAKGRTYGMDACEERRLCALMRERGQLASIEVDGHMRAGLLCTLAGNDVYMHVIAHDPAFDEMRLGYLCCVLCIEAAIAQRLHRFHFLWGWYDYKIRLGGQRQALEHALLWRNRRAAWRHPLWFMRQQWLSLRSVLRERRHARQAGLDRNHAHVH